MFGHLKAEEFVNLMEGGTPSAKHMTHLEACAGCRATFQSLQSVHAEVESLDAGIPEPDWVEFRGIVRDQLLSRSIKRDSTVRRWTGWAVRPAMAWALSLFLAIGVTTVTVVWNSRHRPAPAALEPVGSEAPFEVVDAGPDRGLFDDVVTLDDEEQEQLSQMLVSAPKTSVYRQ
jgi:predicted anti-sigma-YlaC factor YlaD